MQVGLPYYSLERVYYKLNGYTSQKLLVRLNEASWWDAREAANRTVRRWHGVAPMMARQARSAKLWKSAIEFSIARIRA